MKRFTVPENKTIQQMEDATIKFWQDNKIFEKSIEQRPADNLYVFYDGPPFISGLPHYGHLLGSIAKDLIPRYWTMKGKKVERVWGWDAHGLTVENKVQKKLGIKNRRDIESFGLEKFTQECYKYTSEISAAWEWYIAKIGRWVDMEHAYKTIDQNYMESVIWAFKQLWDKGMVYEGVRTSLYCTTCGTPVSNFEVAMDNSYKDVEDPAITVAFPITTKGEFEGVKILAWTTTPWTIPSNTALVVDKTENYVVVESEGSKYIVATKRLDAVFAGKEYKKVKDLLGSDLLGLSYEPPYRAFKAAEGSFKVYEFEGMVNMEDGTGIVHSAPGFGEIDTEMGRKYGLGIRTAINGEGKFSPLEVACPELDFVVGVYYSRTNPLITESLRSKCYLFKEEKITHRFPYHDRCDTLLIQRAQNSWFVDVQKIKKDLLKNNENINWVPEHLKEGRFKQNIEQAPDWCVSRSRFWATPMPVWRSEDGDTIVVGSKEELEKLSGQKVVDLHRPYIDQIKIVKDGKTYSRIAEVLDSWFEAGSMPYAQIHYPFENREKFEENFPGDYIVEYIAQVRAWFHVMHILSTSLFGKNSFKNVITTGVMSGNDGRKMSKTFNNYTDPKEVLEKIGGDALRLYLMGSPLMVGENANFDEDDLKTKLRNVINPLWNSAKFFLIYAEQFNFDPAKSVKSENLLDKWILARLNETILDFVENIEKYHVPSSITPLENFIDDLSRWYVRRSRERLSAGDLEALSTFYEVLTKFAKAAAPAIPFVTEAIYKSVEGNSENTPESVHLCEYPAYDAKIIEDSVELIKDMALLREIVSLGHSARTSSQIAVRQPLRTLEVKSTREDAKLPEEYFEILQDELNVKQIRFVNDFSSDKWLVQSAKDITVALDPTIDADLELEGHYRELVRTLQGLRKSENLSVSDLAEFTYETSEKFDKVVAKYKEDLMAKVSAKSITPGSAFSIKVCKQ